MTSLQDLLDLFPDNSTGLIGANDIRTAITTLWQRITQVVSLPYTTANSPGPASGKVYVSGGWATPTSVQIADTASDDTALRWGLFNAAGAVFTIERNDGGGSLPLRSTGPATRAAGYGTIPVELRGQPGSAPGNNAAVTLYVIAEVDAGAV